MALPQKQPPEVVNLINLVNTHLKWKNLNGPPRGYEVYHPSAFGSCLRQMQYQRYAERGLIEGEPAKPDPRMCRIWETGHIIQTRWEQYFIDMGVLRGYWACRNPLCREYDDEGKHVGQSKDEPLERPRVHGRDNKIGIFKPDKCNCGSDKFDYQEISVVDKELNFHGHADIILDFSNFDASVYKTGNAVRMLFKENELPQKPIVVDMKTINSFKFKKLGALPHFHYRVQLTIYTHILDLQYGVLIYENKDNCDTKIYQVPRNEAMWKKIIEQANVMSEMVEEKKLPPPRPTSKESMDCGYCDFRSICHSSAVWNDPHLREKRRKFYGDFR
tara:strand:+ start:63541 stop:64533 length:993 start_codon:yes stop_codon:yes gene_type:complete